MWTSSEVGLRSQSRNRIARRPPAGLSLVFQMSVRQLRVSIASPGASEPTSVSLEHDEAAVVGRSPDPTRVAADRSAGGVAATLVKLDSPAVSGTHFTIRHDGESLQIIDVGSRNGTWLKLPPRAIVTTEIPLQPLSVSLLNHPANEIQEALEASWTGPADYATDLARTIKGWLERQEIPSRVTVAPASARRGDDVGRLPLATGHDLVVEPLRTVGANWLDALTIASRFVAEQNVLFETEETMRAEGLVVASPAMRRVVARVIEAAASGARALLLTGPSGSGKEGLARLFHRHTGRSGSFVARNCAMFGKELVRAELFGAERGAYTGSVQRVVGAVEMASDGTLFLDEVGELPSDVQPMLLRFLDHRQFERLGGDGQTRTADVRIVTATNRDLRAAAAADTFRSDLWFRLSVHVVEVPSLRERPEDIDAYLRSMPLPRGRSLFDALAPGALDVLLAHDWPGNFRELANFAERTLIVAARGPISADAARTLVREGALRLPTPSRITPIPASAEVPRGDFTALLERAQLAFEADHDGASPKSWDEIKDYVENYAKPVLFAAMSGMEAHQAIDTVDIRAASSRLDADRGTATKQLRRYFDRFTTVESTRRLK